MNGHLGWHDVIVGLVFGLVIGTAAGLAYHAVSWVCS